MNPWDMYNLDLTYRFGGAVFGGKGVVSGPSFGYSTFPSFFDFIGMQGRQNSLAGYSPQYYYDNAEYCECCGCELDDENYDYYYEEEYYYCPHGIEFTYDREYTDEELDAMRLLAEIKKLDGGTAPADSKVTAAAVPVTAAAAQTPAQPKTSAEIINLVRDKQYNQAVAALTKDNILTVMNEWNNDPNNTQDFITAVISKGNEKEEQQWSDTILTSLKAAAKDAGLDDTEINELLKDEGGYDSTKASGQRWAKDGNKKQAALNALYIRTEIAKLKKDINSNTYNSNNMSTLQTRINKLITVAAKTDDAPAYRAELNNFFAYVKTQIPTDTDAQNGYHKKFVTNADHIQGTGGVGAKDRLLDMEDGRNYARTGNQDNFTAISELAARILTNSY